jgi:hypothetical protein
MAGFLKSQRMLMLQCQICNLKMSIRFTQTQIRCQAIARWSAVSANGKTHRIFDQSGCGGGLVLRVVNRGHSWTTFQLIGASQVSNYVTRPLVQPWVISDCAAAEQHVTIADLAACCA